MTTTRDRPQVAEDPIFRSRVRERLVELGNAPGLGVLVNGGDENVVTVFPRVGRPMRTLDDLLAMTWFEVDYFGPERLSDFKPMNPPDVRKLLESLRDAELAEPPAK